MRGPTSRLELFVQDGGIVTRGGQHHVGGDISIGERREGWRGGVRLRHAVIMVMPMVVVPVVVMAVAVPVREREPYSGTSALNLHALQDGGGSGQDQHEAATAREGGAHVAAAGVFFDEREREESVYG